MSVLPFGKPEVQSRFEELWKLSRKSHLKGMAFIEAMSMPEPNTGCWLWLGPVDRKGYGRISMVSYGDCTAHRYSLVQRIGPIGDSHALHTCDQRSCVNPDHLYPGTPAQNTADMMDRGRNRSGGARGEQLSKRLSEMEVSEIKAIYVHRHPVFGLRRLAERYEVSDCTILDIVKGRTWSHVQ